MPEYVAVAYWASACCVLPLTWFTVLFCILHSANYTHRAFNDAYFMDKIHSTVVHCCIWNSKENIPECVLKKEAKDVSIGVCTTRAPEWLLRRQSSSLLLFSPQLFFDERAQLCCTTLKTYDHVACSFDIFYSDSLARTLASWLALWETPRRKPRLGDSFTKNSWL